MDTCWTSCSRRCRCAASPTTSNARHAIHEALAHPRDLHLESLVQGEESRRILDRLFGYTLSPVLWKRAPAPSGARGGCRAPPPARRSNWRRPACASAARSTGTRGDPRPGLRRAVRRPGSPRSTASAWPGARISTPTPVSSGVAPQPPGRRRAVGCCSSTATWPGTWPPARPRRCPGGVGNIERKESRRRPKSCC